MSRNRIILVTIGIMFSLFQWVESNPLVRSSYHAAERVRALSVVHRKLYGEIVSNNL